MARIHVAQYEWKDLCRKIDLTMSNPELVRVICTDFAATLDLLAAAKENASVSNHAFCAIFLVNYNWRKVKFKTDEGTWDEAMVSDCDKWVFFGASMSKGKKTITFFTMHALITSLVIMIKRDKT